ncbi:MAG: imidazole glycerol phosphate synthase subunit HisH [Mycetocola sp.]
MTVGILDYGVGNIGSLVNMFRKIDVPARLVSQPEEIDSVSRLVLPGVGSFDNAMTKLIAGRFEEPLGAFVKAGRPFLGICLGMQLLLDSSEEGTMSGLGFVPGSSRRFRPAEFPGLRVPHMGWNTVSAAHASPMFDRIEEENRFYFVHSYRVECVSEKDVLAWTTYGAPFHSMIARDNVTGAQFHPEKSHVFGMTLLENWSAS